MRAFRSILVILLLLLITGCACTTRRVGDGANIPAAEPGSAQLRDVHFAFDKYDIDAVAAEILRANSDWLKANAGVRVQVEGHCDERGTNEYNMVLGAKRAQAVYDFMRAQGVAAVRMSTISYGEELALDPASNPVAWAKNRRAHFKQLN